MSVLEKAKELADALTVSPELNDMREKEKLVKADSEASQLMDKISARQMELYQLQTEGKEPSPELMEMLRGLQEEMERNNKVMDYLGAQEKMGKILQEVNKMISEALSGGSCEENDCSHCAGC
ncbi:MAG: YlbF family regulator [Desulfitobacteriaceae bacterium]|nr:YlbF family regulator [Desulfitobacteriaceae bacterium]MDD4752049.1 YlbF family regulator [Desulfitobacteriaceae bacterium]